jgi:hypothetical protein
LTTRAQALPQLPQSAFEIVLFHAIPTAVSGHFLPLSSISVSILTTLKTVRLRIDAAITHLTHSTAYPPLHFHLTFVIVPVVYQWARLSFLSRLPKQGVLRTSSWSDLSIP